LQGLSLSRELLLSSIAAVTVVLLHAFPLDERMWAPQVDALAGYDVVAPRLYGRGPSLDEWAAEILEDVSGPFTAVGASIGGYVALAMARQAPERVRGLLLAGSRARTDSPERRAYRDELIQELREHGVPPDMETTARAEELVAATEALRDRSDATDVIRSFRGPFVLAVGDRDELLPVEEARAIVELAPNGRLEVFRGAGHIPSVEEPEEFNAVLLDLVARAGEPAA
jgi:pimeloyl-ACP methyl ester carboxylesterase